MPYISRQRADCNTLVALPLVALERFAVRHHVRQPGADLKDQRDRGGGTGIVTVTRFDPTTVEYLVRAARITDIDRLVTLCADHLGPVRGSEAGGPLDAADLLRQLVFLPQATVVVAELRREIAGGAVLALRPSVRAGGFVGTIDVLAIDPRHDPDRVAEMLIEEVLRSARNKGCVAVDAPRPEQPGELARWERFGFQKSGPRIERAVTSERNSPRNARDRAQG
jgi:ribosomal protein S18 acetylase RimI-like enzyme